MLPHLPLYLFQWWSVCRYYDGLGQCILQKNCLMIFVQFCVQCCKKIPASSLPKKGENVQNINTIKYLRCLCLKYCLSLRWQLRQQKEENKYFCSFCSLAVTPFGTMCEDNFSSCKTLVINPGNVALHWDNGWDNEKEKDIIFLVFSW